MKNIRTLFAMALLAFVSCKQTKQEIKEELPNIVFIISDDQAWTDYGFMGHEVIKTPNIDKLAN